jgi:prolipoprotein diacylglyceryltransferase
MYPSIAVGSLAFSTWRLVTLAALLLCGLLVLRRTRRLGYPALPLLVLGAFEIIVGLTGATLYNALLPRLLHTAHESGLASTGGVLAMLAFGLAYVRIVLRRSPLEVADAAAFALPLFLAIARIGCMLNGCCFGRVVTASVPALVTRLLALPVRAFSPASPAGAAFGHLPPDTLVWNLPLMFSINALASLLIVEVVYRHRLKWRLPAGIALATAFAAEGCGRFLLEFLRQDAHVGTTVFNPWQLGVAAVSALALLFIAVRMRPGGRRAPTAAAVTLLALAGTPADAASIEALSTQRDAGRYAVSLQAHLDVPATAAYAAFADVANWKRFSPDLRQIEILDRHRDGALELSAAFQACVLWYCRLIYGVPDVFMRRSADGGDIYLMLRPNTGDFRSGEAHWRFRRSRSGTDLQFTAEVEPAFGVPAIIGPWLMARWLRTEAVETSVNIETGTSAGAPRAPASAQSQAPLQKN